MAAGSWSVPTRRIWPPQFGQASTSIAKDRLSYCTSYTGDVLSTGRGSFVRRPAVGWTLLPRSVQPLAHLVADPCLEAPLATPPADGRSTDAELGSDLFAGQHATGEQAFLEAGETRRGSDHCTLTALKASPAPGSWRSP